MPGRRLKGSARASAYLDGLLEGASGTQARRLPTIAELSRAAGVAAGTMHRAVRLRVSAGVLSARQRIGIRLVSPQAPDTSTLRSPVPRPEPRTYGSKSAWLIAALQRDLANGVYAPGALLPNGKELCGRYDVGFRTLKAALLPLVHGRLLLPSGRGYRVAVVATPPHGEALLVIGRGTNECLQLVTERTAECVTTLEHECAGRGLALRIAPVDYVGVQPRFGKHLQLFLDSGPQRRRVLGSVLFAAALDQPVTAEVASKVAHAGGPLAIVDEAGAPNLGALPSSPLTRVFSIAYGANCGQQIGRMLAQQGHRHVAYVTAYPGSDWSQQRRQGLELGLSPSREGPPVRVVAIPSAAGEPASVMYTDRIQQAIDRGVHGDMHLHLPLQRGLQWPESQIHRLMEAYGPWKTICRRLEPLLADRDVTAWVADNDPAAIVCLSLLESRRVPVPGRISVTGFDDGNLALVNNLTSYNFNCRAVMIAAMNHLLSPSPAGPRRLEIEGYIAQRGTTGPAARRP